jgi:outer membrane protein OmpA-like peptidoglycan-associated protein
VIKTPAPKTAIALLLVGGMLIASLLDKSDEIESTTNEPQSAQSPLFQIHRLQGELTLSGHTSSQKHEDTLLQIAKSFDSNNHVLSDFEPLGIVPAHWAATTGEALKLLQHTSSGGATLSMDTLQIRAVVIDAAHWRHRFDAFLETVSHGITVTLDTILVDPAISIPSICERAFRSFEHGRINFEESSAEFRSSAYPRMDRLIALALACEDAEIFITGHTDASGNEFWNQQLSVRRARAVGDYMANGGIERDRLRIAGVGSAEPVADDSTRYGRSLNRRIEVSLSNRY